MPENAQGGKVQASKKFLLAANKNISCMPHMPNATANVKICPANSRGMRDNQFLAQSAMSKSQTSFCNGRHERAF